MFEIIQSPPPIDWTSEQGAVRRNLSIDIEKSYKGLNPHHVIPLYQHMGLIEGHLETLRRFKFEGEAVLTIGLGSYTLEGSLTNYERPGALQALVKRVVVLARYASLAFDAAQLEVVFVCRMVRIYSGDEPSAYAGSRRVPMHAGDRALHASPR